MQTTLRLFCFFALVAMSLTAATPPQVIPPSLDETHKGVDFTVRVNGTEPLTYQWYRGTDTEPKKVKLPAPAGVLSTLTLEPPYVAGLYVCEISNSAGTVMSKTFRVSITSQTSAADMQITIKQP